MHELQCKNKHKQSHICKYWILLSPVIIGKPLTHKEIIGMYALDEIIIIYGKNFIFKRMFSISFITFQGIPNL